MKKVYFISGLGADERAFDKLKLPNVEKQYIRWIPHLKNENLSNYAKRLSGQIKPQSSPPILVGLSFGGILAIEISKHIKTEKIILISSIPDNNSLPFLYKAIAQLHLNKLTPAPCYQLFPGLVAKLLFGTQTIEEQNFVRNAILNTEPAFIKWAINNIINWKHIAQSNNLYHIHGTADRLFPHKILRNAIKVEAGGHLMIMSHADRISMILNEIIYQP